MNCADITPNLEAYALGALDTLTQTRVQEHMMECDACRRAALKFAIVVNTLPDALAKRSVLVPPASLKQNLMAAVLAESQAESQAKSHADVRAHAQVAASKPAPVAPRGRWLFNPRVWTFTLATALVVIFGLMTWLTITHLRLQEAISNETAALDQVNTYRLSEDARAALTQFHDPQQVVMTPREPGSEIRGILTFDSKKPYIVFQAYNLPANDLGKQYFLWTMNEGRMQLVARFSPKPNGEAQVSFSVDKDYPVLKRVILTRQVSLREMTDDAFPSNESILEWNLKDSRGAPEW